MGELRIVAGAWRGRRIAVPRGAVRPTADRVREAWLSIVAPALDGARVLDLCAGSGALALEALSRGAEHADFVEKDPKVLTTLRANLATLGAEARATVHRSEAGRFLETEVGLVRSDAPAAPAPRWDVAFADPPYHHGTATALAERWLRAPFAAIFGIEHEAELTLPDSVAPASSDRRLYGDTALTIYRTGP
ncbi:MAG: 16S rRNA (guanine(966)-N(2))-methyltransferase RsmD [Gemmatimonadota bacterium]|jgi:16S rRNA (guanine966-N2)-methyltransferase|nr:16S rRNA (guanine(966)-N(2))-methyltransferase RsmD [Gemmatimonadota bacterium]MDQ8150111.1 16S rRNA (guanine(966)-N(2))-methyltransferase RsmD [Gemmatimonadota bacterium]MDQ8151672.1 16S rRNA (guanine(966)-N(2))-methyltransferase RsmD [Gemmatimonadota bacterium]MDQ8177853.1 16S rRNA (guanine(966)-N(2))-methyltransferase RsmD [Gemmatimonadota bacterium]